ncbi:MAG: agmatine deiminase family protein [Bacteroidota bacterium]
MKVLYFLQGVFLPCFVIITACQPSPSIQSSVDLFYMPAEYEAHEAVWLGWFEFGPYYQPFLDVAKALHGHVPLKMIARSETELQHLKDSLMSQALDTAAIDFFVMEDNRLWMRDHGATYVVNQLGQKKVIDFGWTLYGHKEVLMGRYGGDMDSVQHYYDLRLGRTGLIDSLMGSSEGWSSIKTDVNMEGGSIEVNGKGSLILCETVTMQRNPDLSKSYIEEEFRRVLGVSNIIWMKEGLADDPFKLSKIYDDYYGMGTFGHTDEFVRFANDSTILLAWVSEEEKDLNPLNQMNYSRMSRNLQILEHSTDQDGHPWKIVKVPLPELISERVAIKEDMDHDWDNSLLLRWLGHPDPNLQAGDSVYRVPASSYLNYLVTNEVLLLPTYLAEGTSKEKEQEVIEIFQRYFPNRELALIEPMNLNYFGGGIHCITQQEPKVSSEKE